MVKERKKGKADKSDTSSKIRFWLHQRQLIGYNHLGEIEQHQELGKDGFIRKINGTFSYAGTPTEPAWFTIE